jgi:hypothetical protein
MKIGGRTIGIRTLISIFISIVFFAFFFPSSSNHKTSYCKIYTQQWKQLASDSTTYEGYNNSGFVEWSSFTQDNNILRELSLTSSCKPTNNEQSYFKLKPPDHLPKPSLFYEKTSDVLDMKQDPMKSMQALTKLLSKNSKATPCIKKIKEDSTNITCTINTSNKSQHSSTVLELSISSLQKR